MQLSDNGLGIVGLDDPADTAQQIEDEQIRNHRAVGKAPPLDPVHSAGEGNGTQPESSCRTCCGPGLEDQPGQGWESEDQ